MNARHWYAIQQTADGEAEITLFDEIGFGGTSAKAFISDLKKLSGQRVHLRINSVGGSVVEGTAIYNALRRHQGGLTVHVEALAASMASVVAMAGDEVAIADNALLMIHNPWSMSMGDADDLRKEADVLDKLKSTLVNAYKRKTGMDADEISDMMKEETWLGAEEAVALGFADYIEDGMEAAASITPEAARARFDTFQNSMARKTTKTIKAEEAAPAEVVAEPIVEAPVADEAVDTSSEDNMNAELQAKVDALQADLAAKVEAEAAQAQASEDIAKELETLKAEVERLTAESASKDEEITALLAASKSAGEQAAAIVASVGLEPVVMQPAEQELTPAQIFNNLSGAEAVEYYRNNKREIMASVY
jgi:ATP-dependent protease ClpP protease subunit